jgi:hypothetical protein
MNSALRLLLAAVLMLVLIAASCHQMAIASEVKPGTDHHFHLANMEMVVCPRFYFSK